MDRRKGSCFAATGDLGTNSGWGNLRPTETAPVLGSAPRRSALRKNRRLARTEIVPQLSPPRSVGALYRTATRRALWLPSLSLQRGAKFREGMGNGLRLRITQNDGHKPKTRKGNQIMKNRNIQFKPTARVLIPLLLACFAAVFISAPNPASAGDMVPFNGTVSGYVESQVPVDECTVHTHVINFGNANQLGAFTGTAEFYPNFCEDPP